MLSIFGGVRSGETHSIPRDNGWEFFGFYSKAKFQLWHCVFFVCGTQTNGIRQKSPGCRICIRSGKRTTDDFAQEGRNF